MVQELESQNTTTSLLKTFDINNLIQSYVKPAIGCTEPVAIALAASTAFHAANYMIPSFISTSRKLDIPSAKASKTIENIKRIVITLDPNVLKNALYVNIPGTDMHHGIDLAAILGLFSSPDSELALFESINLTPESLLGIIQQKKLKDRVTIVQKDISGIYIHALIEFDDASVSEALIRGTHSNIISIKLNDQNLINEIEYEEASDVNLDELKELSIQDMVNRVENELNADTKDLIWSGILMNEKVYKLGLEKPYGDGIGYFHKKSGSLQDTIAGQIFTGVAAATDVRMEGYNIPVMSSIGSGNQGLILSVSITILAKCTLNKELEAFSSKEKEVLIKAVALSHELTAYTTTYVGVLSNLCGCLCKAGVGAAAGLAYYLSCQTPELNTYALSVDKIILNSMKNMISSSCGILCDGAKGSCANKAKSAGFNAYTSALEALTNTVGTGGIPGNNKTDIKTIMKNFVETYIEKFGQPTDLHIVSYLLSSAC